jgi:hypothetical protein
MSHVTRRVVLLVPLAAGVCGSQAYAQSTLKKVEETEPKATAIGYRHDSAKVDKARYPKHDVAHRCYNCLAFAPDKPADEWGECDLMSDRLVHRNGWCSSYKKKKG